MAARRSNLSMDEVCVYFNLEGFGLIDEAIILIVDLWSSVHQRAIGSSFTTVVDARRSRGDSWFRGRHIFKFLQQNVLIFFIAFFYLFYFLLQPSPARSHLTVEILLFFYFILSFLQFFHQFSVAFIQLPNFTLPFFFSIKKVSMISQFFLHFFECSIGLSMLHNHSLHLYIEFVIDLFLHFTVHCFHELLKNVFQVLNIATFADLFVKRFVDAHDVGRFGECCVLTANGAEVLLIFVDGLKNIKNESDNAFIPCCVYKISRIDVFSKDLDYLEGKPFNHVFCPVILPNIRMRMNNFLDKLIIRDRVVQIEILPQKLFCLFVHSCVVFNRLIIFKQTSTENY